jgi:hypothetical protein
MTPPAKKSRPRGTPATPVDPRVSKHGAGKAIVPARKSRRLPVAAQVAPAGVALREQLELLESARMQWQFGDWESLSALDTPALDAHPDRARLAMLAACAHQQLDDHAAARRMANLAKAWGCDRKLMARLLLASAHNTLGRASALALDGTRALEHFKAAVQGVGGDARLACQARSAREIARLGLYKQAGEWIERQIAQAVEPAPAAIPSLPAPDEALEPFLLDEMRQIARRCMAGDDVHAAVDEVLQGLDHTRSLHLCVALADAFMERKDPVTAASFLAAAQEHVGNNDAPAMAMLAKRLLATGQSARALDAFIESAVHDSSLTPGEAQSLKNSYAVARKAADAQAAHGHEVLLTYLRAHLAERKPSAGADNPVLIEIGSTRENIAGQGSTRIIADFCRENGIHFITVDMDPHNTSSAAAMFQKLSVDFRAVNAKGEDFLREYSGRMDFVFLDAYDFDHGKHSDFRQSRYEKFLGSRIDEEACHRMHLDCAQSVLAKLAPDGLVCIDDTWLSEGQWQAKGALAMPFLLEQGFELLEARNRAALLRRKPGARKSKRKR